MGVSGLRFCDLLKKLSTNDLDQVCAYPSSQQLKKIVNTTAYSDRPFTLRLALGEPQLCYESFDLSILEFYRNDPRYYYQHDDISGLYKRSQ